MEGAPGNGSVLAGITLIRAYQRIKAGVAVSWWGAKSIRCG